MKNSNNLNLDKLGSNVIAGAETINPIIEWIQGLCSVSEYLIISPNNYGGIDLSIDAAGIMARAAKAAQAPGVLGEFKGTVKAGKLTMSGGHIYVGTNHYSIGNHTRTLVPTDDGKCYNAVITSGGATVTWGDYPTTCLTTTSLTIPLCGATFNNDRWEAYQRRLGAVVIPVPPPFLISGYDASKTQSLDHVGGSLVWHTYKTCNK